MLRKILLGLGGLVVLFILAGYLLPDQVTVKRSISIQKPAKKIYNILQDMSRFNDWSPWHDLDPDTEYTFFGPPRGVGAGMRWQSQKPEVGSGSQTIIALEPDREVRVELDFGKEGKALAIYRIQPQEEGSLVTWSMNSQFGANPAERYVGLFLDDLVGPDFEKGLKRLKELAENKR